MRQPGSSCVRLAALQRAALARGVSVASLRALYPAVVRPAWRRRWRALLCAASAAALCVLLGWPLGARCLLPGGYPLWEATRPRSDCLFCADVHGPLVLHNLTRDRFKEFAYSSKPIIVKGAITHWRAMRSFNYSWFKRLYEETAGSYQSAEEDCQFLNFKSDLFSLREVFHMTDARAQNLAGEKPWYVGWSNCHPEILSKVRQYYDYPDFLPEDAEFPSTENIFFGYEMGAVMHLDYIPRLMWQGQVSGNKSWTLAPIPECEFACRGLQFYVEPGDVVLLDTRVWYHATRVPPGQFALTVQAEYG